jgi:hypothetical protein
MTASICMALVVQFFVVPSLAGATTVVALKARSEIYVGADSKVQAFHSSGSVTEFNQCKLFQADHNLFFSFGGLSGDEKGVFNVPSLVSASRLAAANISEIVSRFEQSAQRSLAAALDGTRQRQPAFYDSVLRNREAVILFVGFENQFTTLHIRRFIPITSANVPVQIRTTREDCPGTCPPGSGIYAFLPLLVSQVPLRFLNANPGYLNAHKPVQTLKKLIDMDIQANPTNAGPPIDILHLTGAKARWIQNQDACPPIGRTKNK